MNNPLRVLLIQPSVRDGIRTFFIIYNTEEGIGFKPPLGLLYMAAAIKERTAHHVEVLDCQLEDINQDNILEHVQEGYDVVGISAWTDFWFQASQIAAKIKQEYPKTHVTLGGPHINIFPEEVLQFPFVDSIILGDGEFPIVRLLDYLSGAGEELPEDSGVYLRGRRYAMFSPYVCRDLDVLPIPDRTLLPVRRYRSVLSPADSVTTLISSRGCPYHCVYCKMNYHRPVMRSARNVIEELKVIAGLGIPEVEFYDDTFNWDHRRTREICDGILKNKLKIKWAVRDRVDRVDDEVYALMRRAGCYRVHLGIESGVDRVLKMAKKNITTAQADNAVRIARKNNFTVLSYFMYGLPGETMEEARETLRFALELDTDYAEFSITIPYPGTEAYEDALHQGIIPIDYWRDFTRDPVANFVVPCVIENMISREQLIRLRDESIRKFYFRPKYILREIGKLRNLSEFVRKARMGIGLFNILRKKFVR